MRILRFRCTAREHEKLRIRIENGAKEQCLGCGGIFIIKKPGPLYPSFPVMTLSMSEGYPSYDSP